MHTPSYIQLCEGLSPGDAGHLCHPKVAQSMGGCGGPGLEKGWQPEVLH